MNLETQIRIKRNQMTGLKYRLRDAETELLHNPQDPLAVQEVADLTYEIEELERDIEELEYQEEREADES